MKKVQVEIVKETQKAYLVQDQAGRQAWIQKRWLAEGNMVNVKTFEKNVEWLKNRDLEIEREKQRKAEAKLKRQELIELGEIVRETEKAVAVTATWQEFNVEKAGGKLVWFPKSQITDGKVPYWLVEAKAVEVCNSAGFPDWDTLEVSLCGRTFMVNGYGVC